MSLLHATWLPAIRTSSSSGQPALLVWADTWRVATPEGPGLTPALHPFTLSHDDLRAWLSERDLLPGGCIDATACLTLPSRTVKPRKSRTTQGRFHRNAQHLLELALADVVVQALGPKLVFRPTHHLFRCRLGVHQRFRAAWWLATGAGGDNRHAGRVPRPG